MNPSTGTFISMDTYEGSIYDPDTLHKYLYANGNPVMYTDPSGNMFTLTSAQASMGIQSIIDNCVQIACRGLICGLINSTLTAIMGGSIEDACGSFVSGFLLGAGLSAVRYFVVGAEIVTLARFYVLSASANFIFSTTITLFAISQGYSELAIMFGVMAVLSVAELCWAYGNYLLMDVYGPNGKSSIEIDPYVESGDGKKRILYRGEKASVTPNDVFENGIDPKGTHNDALLHTKSNLTAGDFVSTTSDKEIATQFAGKKGYVYVIETSNYY